MIEAIKKLRQYAPNSVPGVRSELLLIADEIEREIDARYMELPVDADGVPILVGDEMMKNGIRIGRVTSVGFHGAPRAWVLPKERNVSVSFVAEDIKHVKLRTVEDVLMDVLRDSTHTDMGNSDIIEKYAAELRMAGDEE